MAAPQYGHMVGGGRSLGVAGLVSDGEQRLAAMGLPTAILETDLVANGCLGQDERHALWLECKGPPATADQFLMLLHISMHEITPFHYA